FSRCPGREQHPSADTIGALPGGTPRATTQELPPSERSLAHVSPRNAPGPAVRTRDALGPARGRPGRSRPHPGGQVSPAGEPRAPGRGPDRGRGDHGLVPPATQPGALGFKTSEGPREGPAA